MQRLYGDRARDILKAYRVETDAEVEQVATELASDRFIAFSTWRWANLQAKTGAKPVYPYHYSHPRPPMVPDMGDASAGLAGSVQRGASTKTPPSKGAVHSAEIEYALGNLASNKVYAWTPSDYKVSQTMQEYFANFIKKGDPNVPQIIKWLAANSGNPAAVMHININSRVMPDKHHERYLLLEEIEGSKANNKQL